MVSKAEPCELVVREAEPCDLMVSEAQAEAEAEASWTDAGLMLWLKQLLERGPTELNLVTWSSAGVKLESCCLATEGGPTKIHGGSSGKC